MLSLNVTKEDLRKRLAEEFRIALYHEGGSVLCLAGANVRDAARTKLDDTRPDSVRGEVVLAVVRGALVRTLAQLSVKDAPLTRKVLDAAKMGVAAMTAALDALADELAVRHADELAALLEEPRPAEEKPVAPEAKQAPAKKSRP
jgi:hypothetical protein